MKQIDGLLRWISGIVMGILLSGIFLYSLFRTRAGSSDNAKNNNNLWSMVFLNYPVDNGCGKSISCYTYQQTWTDPQSALLSESVNRTTCMCISVQGMRMVDWCSQGNNIPLAYSNTVYLKKLLQKSNNEHNK